MKGEGTMKKILCLLLVFSLVFVFATPVLGVAAFAAEQISNTTEQVDDMQNFICLEMQDFQSEKFMHPLAQKFVELEGKLFLLRKFAKTPGVENALKGKDITATGWIEFPDRYERKIGAKFAMVRLGDEIAKADENGYFKFYKALPGKYDLELFDREGNKIISIPVEITNKNSIKHQVLLPKAHCCQKGNTGLAIEIQTTNEPCRDYNGPFGNCVDNNSFINFIMSDCDYAMGQGYCWIELMPGHSCYHPETGTNCSPLIGCPSYHHCH